MADINSVSVGDSHRNALHLHTSVTSHSNPPKVGNSFLYPAVDLSGLPCECQAWADSVCGIPPLLRCVCKSYLFFWELLFLKKIKDMLEFFEYLYIDLKLKAIGMNVESVDFGIRLTRF